MASAIMQLHAKGSQDIATIVNPEITFWKTVYPRHTNFAWDDAIITQSTGTSDYGQLVEFKLPRSGDLVTNCTLMVEMGTVKNWESNLNTPNPKLTDWNPIFQSTDPAGLRALIRSLYLRGIYGDEMSELIAESNDLSAVNYVIENALYTDKLEKATLKVDTTTHAIEFTLDDFGGTTFKIPHTLVPDAEKYNLDTPKYTITASGRNVWVADPPSLSVRLMCRYIYLDDFERRQFAVNTHEYIVTEYQHHQHFVTAGADQVSIDLKFNHPTKELIFFYRADEWWGDDSAKTQYNGYWSFANTNSAFGDNHLFSTANLVLNSQNVYGDGRDPVYFSSLLPSHFHSRAWDDRIYIIPFSLQPDSWKPTGSINLSRLDDVKLVLKRTGPLKPGCIHVYAKNFNVIKIQNGMGGKRYAS
eukprot:jgi/Mesvir1/21208/Mv02862-RA.1